jgi:GT2 family glycosyltransferase
MKRPRSKQPERQVLEGTPRRGVRGLARRIVLTYRYQGLGSLIYRLLTFPLRFTPIRPLLRLEPRARHDRSTMLDWYREEGRPVTIVVPSYRDSTRIATLVRSIRETTEPTRVRIIVADDASGPEHLSALRKIDGIEVVAGETNIGFAANVNRGLSRADPAVDVVILNSDTVVLPGWLACLQYAAHLSSDIGIVGPKLLYENHRIQSAGTIRHPEAPEWFDHRCRFQPSDSGPANVPVAVLAATGACMYVKNQVFKRIGLLDESYPMAYEDVDFCLRAWRAGFSVMYAPQAEALHLESVTRGNEVGERERRSQRVFWERWGDFFDARNVRTPAGALRVIYVTEDTGVGGGHRDIFEHLNGLRDRGHDVELWTLADAPDWFDLRAPVRSFNDHDELSRALEPVEAIKVATWWNTAAAVWSASVVHGIPVYFVQDIETSYYPDDLSLRHAVLASYRDEFRYMTISSWNRERLRELGQDATLIPPGIDLKNFRPLPGMSRRTDMVLALGRSNPLKNLPLTIAAWRLLPDPRPELCLFGIEPHLAEGEPGIRYVNSPTDEEVNRLFNEATVFVQTSVHEGFCLPPLEAMATGCAVVCTDAHGNRDFCEDTSNCLVPKADRRSVAAALQQVLADDAIRERLGGAGIKTAAEYAWPRRIDALERFFTDIAMARRIQPSSGVVPQMRRAPVS